MKKGLLIITLIVLVVITGCSNDESSASTDDSDGNTQYTQKDNKDKLDNLTDKKVDERSQEEIEREGSMVKVGQTDKNPNGDAELMKIKEFNKTIKQGSLKIELVNAKIIKMTDLSQGTLNHFNQFARVSKGNPVSYLQIRYVVENTSDQDVRWEGLKNLVTDQKEQVDVNVEEIFMLNTGNDLLGNVKKSYNQGFVLDETNVNEIRLIFGEVYSEETYDTLAEEIEYKFSFK